MAKQIKFKFDGTDYVLEYTRRTVRELEAEGFNTNEIDTKPMTMIPLLVAGAFRKNHRFTKPDTIDKIYQAVPRKDEFVQALAEMYNETVNTLIEEPTADEGNVQWETVG